jgi:hypothetical protein
MHKGNLLPPFVMVKMSRVAMSFNRFPRLSSGQPKPWSAARNHKAVASLKHKVTDRIVTDLAKSRLSFNVDAGSSRGTLHRRNLLRR